MLIKRGNLQMFTESQRGWQNVLLPLSLALVIYPIPNVNLPVSFNEAAVAIGFVVLPVTCEKDQHRGKKQN